jgi:excisionase family DNA binding protein
LSEWRLPSSRCKPHFAAGDLVEHVKMTVNVAESLARRFETLALRPREAAPALGISPRLLWQLTHDGEIPCVRVGSGKRKAILYPVASLQAWLSRQAAAAKGGQP